MKYFTPDHADRTLPLVRRIALDLMGLQSDLCVRQSRIELLSSEESRPTSKAHAEELRDMRASIHEDQQRMLTLQDELAELGAVIHSQAQGIIDFPAQLGSRSVRLCWRVGEPKVGHWHEVRAPLSQRRRITDERFAEPASLTLGG